MVDTSPTSIFCIHCGARNSAASRFCLNCGQLLAHPQDLAPAGGDLLPDRGKNACPYCGEIIQPAPEVDQLVCLGCGASLRVRRVNGQPMLEALRY